MYTTSLSTVSNMIKWISERYNQTNQNIRVVDDLLKDLKTLHSGYYTIVGFSLGYDLSENHIIITDEIIENLSIVKSILIKIEDQPCEIL